MKTRSQSVKPPPAAARVPTRGAHYVSLRPPPLRRSPRLLAADDIPEIEISEAMDSASGPDAIAVPLAWAGCQSKIVSKRVTERGEEEYCVVTWVAAPQLKDLSQEIAQYEASHRA